MPWLYPHCSWRYASRLAFPLQCSMFTAFCAPWTAPMCSLMPGYGHRAGAQPVLTAVSKTPFSNVLFCAMHFLGKLWDFPTDWEEDFPAQLTQCLPEDCDMAFSSTIILWKKLPVIIHYLTSACSWWGRTNIKSTHRQSQADAVSLCYWMQLIRKVFFFPSGDTPLLPHSTADSKEILNLSAEKASSFLTAREYICKWK